MIAILNFWILFFTGIDLDPQPPKERDDTRG